MYLDNFCHIGDLFAQLGLSAEAADIESFIQAHRPLSKELNIWEAPWWTPGQADFLHQGLKDNSDWVAAIDELNQRLSHTSAMD